MKKILIYTLSFTLLFCKEKDEILEMYQSEIDKVQLSKVFDKLDKRYIYKISIQFDEILFDIIKIQDKWKISYNEKSYLVEDYLINGLFYYFNKQEAERIIHIDKQYWNKYNLDDTNAFKIKFFSNIQSVNKDYVFGINHYNKLKFYLRMQGVSENVYSLNKDAEHIYQFLIDICKYFIQVASLDNKNKLKYIEKIYSKEKLFIRKERKERDVFIAFDKAPSPKIQLDDLIIYPEHARKAGIQGKVFVSAFINEHGIVTETRIVRGLPNTGLDEAAIEAVKKSRWHPARQRDKKVGVWLTVPIVFSLQ